MKSRVSGSETQITRGRRRAFRFRPFQLLEANPGRLRPIERSQPLDNPGGARQRDGREFGPEMGRRRAERVNRSGRARRRRGLVDGAA